jgi:hypothetical protein
MRSRRRARGLSPRAARTAHAAAAKNSVALWALSHHECGRTGGAKPKTSRRMAATKLTTIAASRTFASLGTAGVDIPRCDRPPVEFFERRGAPTRRAPAPTR